MSASVEKAVALIFSADRELLNILATTARMSLASSLIALLLGVPIGIWLGACRFRGRGVLVVLTRTLMGMPPVVCGLLFYLLFSGVGPFRHLRLLFTVPLMVLAQVVLITPIVAGSMETSVSALAPALRETARGLGFGAGRRFLLLLNERVYPVISAYLLAFSRAIAWKTNVMTTAIMQYTTRGDFTLGIALGLILLTLSLIVNAALSLMQRRLSR